MREEAGTTTPAQFVPIQNLSGFGIVFFGVQHHLCFHRLDHVSVSGMVVHGLGTLFMVGQALTTFCFTIWLLTRLAAV